MEKLKVLSAYLPFNLKVIDNDNFIMELEGIDFLNNSVICERTNWKTSQVKPILFSLEDLTKEINICGETFVPIEVFEVSDDDNSYPFEHSSRNIGLMRDLKHISKYDLHHDIIYLPFEVVTRLISWRFNVFGLKENEYVKVTNEFNPYK